MAILFDGAVDDLARLHRVLVFAADARSEKACRLRAEASGLARAKSEPERDKRRFKKHTISLSCKLDLS